MPKVGSRKFPYTPQGMRDARRFSNVTKQPMASSGMKRSSGMGPIQRQKFARGLNAIGNSPNQMGQPAGPNPGMRSRPAPMGPGGNARKRAFRRRRQTKPMTRGLTR